MRPFVAVALLGVFVSSVEAGQAPVPASRAASRAIALPEPAVRQAQAYDAFIEGQQLERQRQTDAAIVAYKRAIDLDPSAADIPATLADLYLRHDKNEDAQKYAELALKVSATNRDAHRVLGILYAMRSEIEGAPRGATARDAEARRRDAATAIEHLEQALDKAVGETDPNMRATLSRLYLQTGTYDKAIPLLADLVLQEPGWPEGPMLLASAYQGANKLNEGIAWLEGAVAGDPALYATLADFYEKQRRFGDAARAYETGVRLLPRNFDLKARYAAALLNLPGRADVEKAKAVLADVLAVRPTDARALYQMAQAQRRLQDLVGAETTARKLIAQSARSPWGYYALAEVLEERRQYQGVLEALEPAVATFRRTNPDGQELGLLLPHLGFAYAETGQAGKAVETFKDARRLAPGDGAVTAYLIQSYITAAQYREAIDLATEVQATRPDDLRVVRLLATARAKNGQLAEAVAGLNAVIARRPGDTALVITLSQIYVDAQRPADAVSALQAALKAHPDDEGLTFQLGATLDKAKRSAEAEALFRGILAKQPENAGALNYLGYMLAESGRRLDEAVALLKRAVAIEPENGSFLDSLGWAYFKSGKLDLAEAQLKRAAEQLVTNSVVQDHYGDLLAKRGRLDEALAAWTRAQSGDKESLDVAALDKKIRNARQKLGKP